MTTPSRMPSFLRKQIVPFTALALVLLLSACDGGGGGASGSNGTEGVLGVAGRDGTNGQTTLALIAAEPAGSNCAAGGNRISAGLDVNANGVLDSAEITSTQFVCNGVAGAIGPIGITGINGEAGAIGPVGFTGADGTPGMNGVNGSSSLVVLANEAAGANCTQGGTSVSVGIDASRDGVLDAGEVTSVGYVCHGTTGATGATGPAGADGAPGAPGADGATGATGAAGAPGAAGADGAVGTTGATGATGVAGADGAPGATGATGALGAPGADGATGPVGATGATGSAGPDGPPGPTGPVGVQGPVGATGTTGSAGSNSLVVLVNEAAGANCQYAGKKVTSGIDTNANSVLDTGEVQSTAYVCNGAPGPGLTFIAITANTQAASFMGYVANAATQLTVTLPVTPAIGDIVDITGAGSGGWKVAQNAGQSIRFGALPVGAVAPGGSYTASTGSTVNSLDVRGSSDLQRQVTFASTRLFGSTNRGVSVTPILTTSGGTLYQGAMSANGMVIVAPAYGGPGVYVSTDGGVTFAVRTFTTSGYPAAVSDDGIKQYVAGYGQQIYASTDSGATWTAHGPSTGWYGVASSADGTKVVGVVLNGFIYTSTDSGVTFTQRATSQIYQQVASSADGTKLLASVQGGFLNVSTDSGVTWTARAVSGNWWGVSMSGDGVHMAAVNQSTGLVYTSADSGTTWIAQTAAVPSPRAIKVSSDFSRFAVASSATPGLFESPGTSTAVGVTGFLSGSQYDAVALQFVGSGLWVPLNYASFSGAFTAQ